MRFERLQVVVRLDTLRGKRAMKKNLATFDKKAARLEAAAKVQLAGFADEGLFEPLNREERRLFEKLSRRGQLPQWYARRLAQVRQDRLIPYVRVWLTDLPRTRAA